LTAWVVGVRRESSERAGRKSIEAVDPRQEWRE